jgi:hypothetical protein
VLGLQPITRRANQLPSFIDEFVGAVCGVIQRGHLNNRYVIFTGEDSHIIELIDTILQRRGCLIKYALNPGDVLRGELSVLGDPTQPRPIPA